MERREFSLNRGSNYVIPREWSHGDLVKAKNKLKVGAKVEVRLGDSTGFGLTGKKFKGTVTEKYDNHFIVRVKAKNGEWNESLSYIDLMNEKKVKVLKK